MKKITLFAAVVLMATTAVGQTVDTYIGAQLATEDLNGTARYIGMGGAMDALGADISTIGSNPAGIGLFRRSQASLSFGVVSQEEGRTFQNGSKTHVSFDQIGMVLSTRTGRQSFFNFAFNYHKSRNFNYVLAAAAQAVNGSSQNRQTYIKLMNNNATLENTWMESQTDVLCYDLMDVFDEFGEYETTKYYNADSYQMNRAQTGYIGEYDFNLSGNINDRVYLGITLGIKDVHYNSYSEYTEQLQKPLYEEQAYQPFVRMTDDHQITGNGFRVTAGTIIRPVEDSPFRIGFSVATPTWYTLRSQNFTTVNVQSGRIGDVKENEKFRMNTPWKFGVSAGHVVGNIMALGASFEYTDYSALDLRNISGTYYDWDGYYHESSNTDRAMEGVTNRSLKGVSTLKVGMEVKPDPTFAIRAGYNYQTAIYKTSGVRDLTVNSPGVFMSSTTDYTNWKDTHRITVGGGVYIDKFRLDLAYQYSMRKGDFYPYMDGYSGSYTHDYLGEDGNIYSETEHLTNRANPVSVKDNRHQVVCSLTYTF